MNSTETKTELPIHSEIPWYWKSVNDGLYAHRICSKNGVIIADALWHETVHDIAPLPPMAKANADFIVEACNNYDTLRTRLEAVENLEWRYSHDEIEASCGGGIALEVRSKVLKRREAILKSTAEAMKGEG